MCCVCVGIRYPSWPVFQQQLESLKAIANQHDDRLDESKSISSSPLHTTSTSSSSSSPPSLTFPSARLSRSEAWQRYLLQQPLSQTIWLQSQVQHYLTQQPAATQTATSINSTLLSLRRYLSQHRLYLTNIELLQLINLCPVTLVEIHRIIEECEERFSEEQTLALLDLIKAGLKPQQEQVQQSEMADKDMHGDEMEEEHKYDG